MAGGIVRRYRGPEGVLVDRVVSEKEWDGRRRPVAIKGELVGIGR